MPSYLSFSILFFLCILSAYSQHFPSEKQADAFIAALQKQKVDTICTLKHDGIGVSKIIMLDESCKKKEDKTYVFWKQNGKTYLVQKNNCNEHPPVEIKDDSFWEVYFVNKATIETEKIKWPEYLTEDKIGNQKYTISYSHYVFDQIVVYNKFKFESLQEIPDYCLNEKVSTSGKTYSNINYENNKNSYTNKFREQLNLIIQKNSKQLTSEK